MLRSVSTGPHTKLLDSYLTTFFALDLSDTDIKTVFKHRLPRKPSISKYTNLFAVNILEKASRPVLPHWLKCYVDRNVHLSFLQNLKHFQHILVWDVFGKVTVREGGVPYIRAAYSINLYYTSSAHSGLARTSRTSLFVRVHLNATD